MEQSFSEQPTNDLSVARDEANAWLAKFAPLLNVDDMVTKEQCESALATLADLKTSGETTYSNLNRLGQLQDQSLISTVQQAQGQLASVEEDVRKRLAVVKPGAPQGIVNLQNLVGQLAERAARQELPADEAIPDQLELVVSTPNYAAAASPGVFALGWNLFTTVHACFFIWGMWHAVGWPAIFMLLFYALFWGAGYGMILACRAALSTQTAIFSGRDLTVRDQIRSWIKEKQYRLPSDASAVLDIPSVAPVRFGNTNQMRTGTTAITLADEKGKPIMLGQALFLPTKEKYVKQINLYLNAHRYDP